MSIEKYLENYAEDIVHSGFCDSIIGTWDRLVVIPSCGEDHLENAIASICESAQHLKLACLILVCINERGDASNDIKAQNKRCLSLCKNFPCVTVINRTERNHFPDKEGVGLARKILGDVALVLYTQNKINHDYVWMTDADVTVPKDYLAEVPILKKQPSAYTYPFTHNHLGHRASEFYEFSLRYYVAGLHYAGSPYAFDAIGSSIIYHQKSYALVRGIPKRLAAEDFYFLNKIAKVGSVQYLEREPIVLSGRPSDRVPFGTGMSVIKITEQLQNHLEFKVYDPRCFELLKDFLQKSENTKAFHDKFDGFRTLKFIHKVRDEKFPNITLDTLRKTDILKELNYHGQPLEKLIP